MKVCSSCARAPRWLGVCVIALVVSWCPRARAFGGLWSAEPAQASASELEVVFVDDARGALTAIIRVGYQGPARELAWVIPVPGMPSVALSSSTIFERLGAATAPEHWLEVGVEGTCSAGEETPQLDAGAGGDELPIEPGVLPSSVTIHERGAVGDYEYVTLGADRDADGAAQAAIDWLTANGYALNGLERELLAPYLEEGLNLLAFKLVVDGERREIRPVAVSYDAARPSIPLRLMTGTAQGELGIELWLFGPSQAVPISHPSLVLNDALIDWLSGRHFALGTLPSGGDGPVTSLPSLADNYDAVVAAAAAEAGARGFVTELGAPASQFREKVWSILDEETRETLAQQSFADGFEALVAASALYAGWDGFAEAVRGASTLPDGMAIEDLIREPEAYRDVAEIDAAKLLERVDQDVLAPVADAAAMLQRAPYLTRLSTRLSAREAREADTPDPTFDYNPDLAQLETVHVARQRVECSAEQDLGAAPWRIELPQGGVVEGEGQGAWPVALGSMPANLAIVTLDTSGSGTVIEDNADAIALQLPGLADPNDVGVGVLEPPQHGLTIGGRQTLLRVETEEPPSSTDGGRERSGADGCSVARAGTRPSGALAPWSLLLGLALALGRRRAFGLLLLAASSGCGDERARDDAGATPAPVSMSLQELRDPETCKGCHPNHYRQWSSSMHAYAAQDPVFVAMNARGQRETHGELGDFCIRCHAPMAVVDGLSRDGLDLHELPDQSRGVSCYYCHNVVGIEGDHNAMLHIANDDVMRGPIRDPLQPGVHRAEHSEMFEDTSPESSTMCGACHDIVTPNGVHLERTLEEYRSGIFSKSATGEPPAFDSCTGCHMPPSDGLAAEVPGLQTPTRTVHEHVWPGIDTALIEFPYRDAMRSAVEDCQLGLAVSFFTLEVTPPDLFTFQLENSAGHHTPSGAAQDRRMWLELLAYDSDGELIEEASSGNIADGELEEQPEGHPDHDPRLTMYRDRIYGADGEPVHMFWEAAASAAHPNGYESRALPVATTTYVEGRHAVVEQYRVSARDGSLPARVTARLRMRPIGMDVLQSLVDSGDLDQAIADRMPTFTFGARIEWTPDKGMLETIRAEPSAADCSTYRCLLDPSDCR